MAQGLTPIPGRIFSEIDTQASISSKSDLQLPPVILGGGVFGYDYNSADTLESDIPTNTVRLCFRYGITTVDTSPYYTTSEARLGKAFAEVADEFPRHTYQIITKCGRYGRTKEDGFDYSPERIRASIENSLSLMKTDYLDGVYMHDVEFVAEAAGSAGLEGICVDPATGEIKDEDLKQWGLSKEDEGRIYGPGDEKVLLAMKTLFELKKEGVIRAVGFSGFPLPALLRIARLVTHHVEPLDIMQTYCHHTLQNTSLSTFLPLFYAAGVKQVISASPLAMGLLRSQGGQAWHPASPALKEAAVEAANLVKAKGSTLEEVALGYGLTSAAILKGSGEDTPTVVGLSTPEEVHETMKVYTNIYHQKDSRKGRIAGSGLSDASEEQLELENIVTNVFKKSNTLNWTWMQGR